MLHRMVTLSSPNMFIYFAFSFQPVYHSLNALSFFLYTLPVYFSFWSLTTPFTFTLLSLHIASSVKPLLAAIFKA